MEHKLNELTAMSKINSIGLLGGDAGSLLYKSITKQITFEDLEKELNHCLNIVSTQDIKLDFCVGLAGLSWLFQYLNTKNYINIDVNELFEETDEYLYKWMMSQIKIGNYDFLHGAVGVGIYFLSRTFECNKVKDYVVDLINGLEEIAIYESPGCIKFITTLDPHRNLKGYNLSLSHGISSIIYFLAKAYKQNLNTEKALNLLTNSVNFLIESKLPSSDHSQSIFPNWVCSQDLNNSSRLAWCYGDLGIGITLYNASVITKRKDWEKLAIEVLLNSAERKDLERNGVEEAIMCHGTAGIGQVFYRMYQNIQLKEFKHAANYWFNETKKMMKFEQNEIRIWGGNEKGWINDINILGGTSGILLAIYCWENNLDPDWDQCFLLS